MKLRSGVKTTPSEEGMGSDRGDKAAMESLDHTVTFFRFRFNYVVVVTHFNIFLYASCFFIQIGTLPYLSKKLGVDVTMFGYLQTMFAVVQLCGGPLFGRFGDLFGGRAALTLAFASAALSYGLMGFAYSFPALLLSRLPSIFMHAMQGGQMVVTDLTDSSQRADALGKLGVSYGVGMVVGPFIGGIINTQFGEHQAALVACAGSLFSMVMVRLTLPSHTKKSPVTTDDEGKSKTSVFNFKKIFSLLRGNPQALTLLTIKTVIGIPLGIFQSMFSIFAMEKFRLAADQNGYIMSYIGIVSMLIQGVGIGLLTKRFSENSLIKWASFTLIWSWLLMAFVQNVWQLCIVMLPKVFGLVIITVVISSSITKTVPSADTGTMLGINMAVHSLVGTLSPTIGGRMMAEYGFSSISYLGAVASTLVFIAVTLRHFNSYIQLDDEADSQLCLKSAMLGINMAVNSMIRTVSPTIGGLMLQHLGFSSFGYFGCVTGIVVTSYLFSKVND